MNAAYFDPEASTSHFLPSANDLRERYSDRNASPHRTSKPYHRDSISSPGSSACDGQSPSAGAIHTHSASHDDPSHVAGPATPKPYRGASTPFPLPVGKRSLGGLAALDEQMQAATLGRLSEGDDKAEPTKLGMTRCYWTLLSTRSTRSNPYDLTFMFCDPVLQSHMGPEKDLIIGKSFFDFVHPAEREQAKDDLRNIVASRTLFGSVTRCRYFRVPAIRETLGCSNAQRDPEAHLYTSDDLYLPIDIVLNMVGDSMALCFFHAVLNKTSNDNDEAHKSHWTNWCGTPRALYDVEQCNRLWSLVSSHDIQSPEAPTRKAFPSYIFQLLSMPEDNSFPEIIFSWPPPRLYVDEQSASTARDSHEAFEDGSYFADEFAKLAQEVRTSPSAKTQNGQTTRNGESGTIQDGANTSCTRRFRAKHTLTTEGMVRSVESVLVPYGSVMLACFNTTYQQIMSRASAARDLSPARAPTGTSLPPNHLAMYPLMAKRNRGHEGPHREARSGGLPLHHDSIVTHPGESHWPPAVSRTHPLGTLGKSPLGTARDLPPAGNGDDGPQRGRSHSATRHTAASLYSKRKTNSEPEEHDGSLDEHRGRSSRPPSGDRGRRDGSGVRQPVSGSASANGSVSSAGAQGAEHEADKRCTSCGTSNSPEWRKGPTGQKTLCNACGLRYSRSVSRQQKKAGKARADLLQKQQQQAFSSPSSDHERHGGPLTTTNEPSYARHVGIPGPAPPAPPSRSQDDQYYHYSAHHGHDGQRNRHSPSYHPPFEHVPDARGPKIDSAQTTTAFYPHGGTHVPHVGYGHGTVRKIASMGWGTPPGDHIGQNGPAYEETRERGFEKAPGRLDRRYHPGQSQYPEHWSSERERSGHYR
ncbi:unnamed protein product [Sympodiomycopsis kandeliae]